MYTQILSILLCASLCLAGPTDLVRPAALSGQIPGNIRCQRLPPQRFARDLIRIGLPPLTPYFPFHNVRSLCARVPIPCLGIVPEGPSAIPAELPSFDTLVVDVKDEIEMLESLILSSSPSSLPSLPHMNSMLLRFEIATPSDMLAEIPSHLLPEGAEHLPEEGKAFLERLQKFCLAAAQLFDFHPTNTKILLLRLSQACFDDSFDILDMSPLSHFDLRLLAYCADKCVCGSGEGDEARRLADLRRLEEEVDEVERYLQNDPIQSYRGGDKQGGSDTESIPPFREDDQRGDRKAHCHDTLSSYRPSSYEPTGVCKEREIGTRLPLPQMCGATCAGPSSRFCSNGDTDGCRCVRITPEVKSAFRIDGYVGGAVCLVTTKLMGGGWGFPSRGNVNSLLSAGSRRKRADAIAVEAECMCNSTVSSTACCGPSTLIL